MEKIISTQLNPGIMDGVPHSSGPSNTGMTLNMPMPNVFEKISDGVSFCYLNSYQLFCIYQYLKISIFMYLTLIMFYDIINVMIYIMIFIAIRTKPLCQTNL